MRKIKDLRDKLIFLFYCCAGFSISNLIYQYAADKPDFHFAIKASFFQIVAMAWIFFSYISIFEKE